MKEVTENVKLYSIEESCFFSLVCFLAFNVVLKSIVSLINSCIFYLAFFYNFDFKSLIYFKI